MRRIARHLFSLPSALPLPLPLVLCVAVCVLWARSERVIDRVVLQSSPTTFRAIGLREGAVYYVRTHVYGRVNQDTFSMDRMEGPPGFRTVAFSDTLIGSSMFREDEFLGFFHGKTDIAPGQEALEVSVPLWPVLIVPGVWLSLVLRTRTQADRRNRSGLCPLCGYDLRASPQRCPECGAAVNGSSAQGLAATAHP